MIFKHGLVFLNRGRVLLVKKKGLDKLIVPGGKPETGECFRDTLKREIQEELSSDIDSKSLEFFGSFRDTRPEKEGYLVHIDMHFGKIKGNPEPSSEIEGMKWADSGTDPSSFSPIVKNKIMPALISEGYVK